MANWNGVLTPTPIGTVAHSLVLPHTLHSTLALRSLSGRPVVLAFYPMDWEPVSREQLTLYQDYGEEFARFGARLLGISIDHVHSHEAFARAAKIGFPLLADFQPRGAVARCYGVYRVSAGVSARALFVLDETHVIRFSKAYPDLLNPGIGEILATLESMTLK